MNFDHLQAPVLAGDQTVEDAPAVLSRITAVFEEALPVR